MSAQDCKRLMLFQGGSHASRTALQESVKRLVTSVICGRKCGALLEKLNPDGSWEKTCGDYCQVKMDGFLDEFSGTWPQLGTMRAGAGGSHRTDGGVRDGNFRTFRVSPAWH